MGRRQKFSTVSCCVLSCLFLSECSPSSSVLFPRGSGLSSFSSSLGESGLNTAKSRHMRNSLCDSCSPFTILNIAYFAYSNNTTVCTFRPTGGEEEEEVGEEAKGDERVDDKAGRSHRRGGGARVTASREVHPLVSGSRGGHVVTRQINHNMVTADLLMANV